MSGDAVQPRTVPPWLLRRLPANAATDEGLAREIDSMVLTAHGNLTRLTRELNNIRQFCEYDSLANQACAKVWLAKDVLLSFEASDLRSEVLAFTQAHMPPAAQARIFRRLVRDPHPAIRLRARRAVEGSRLREVSLPPTTNKPWDTAGWLRGTNGGRLFRHGPAGPVQLSLFGTVRQFFRRRSGREPVAERGLPTIANLAELRQLLGIRSPQQLGYLLLATDAIGGPYTRFTIPKQDGAERSICAPKDSLRWVQRKILRKILDGLPVHDAAHGFVRGRSTVSNASRHCGAEVVVKFDLEDFFPTIHYYRVMGLFASLGYPIEDARFGTGDTSRQIAAVLARLCIYTPDPQAWGTGSLPQGAPTSPAISNLICRGLDARLAGLAAKTGAVYTRYADDLTFSFRKAAIAIGRFRWWVDQICHQEGFLVNQRKFRVVRSSQRQIVTGIVVNDSPHVPREERRRFRAMLHNCRQKGVASQASGNPGFRDYLRGFASYLHMVSPEEGRVLLREVNEVLSGSGSAEGGMP
jgi:RNA-directed DNA polymerase